MFAETRDAIQLSNAMAETNVLVANVRLVTFLRVNSALAVLVCITASLANPLSASPCGNHVRDVDEQCDSGTQCNAMCKCNPGYEPLSTTSTECRGV